MQDYDAYDDDDMSLEEVREKEIEAYGILYDLLKDVDPSFSVIVESDIHADVPLDEETQARICVNGYWVMTAHVDVIKEYGDITQSVFIEMISEPDFQHSREICQHNGWAIKPDEEDKFDSITALVKQNADAMLKAAAYYDMLEQTPEEIAESGLVIAYNLQADDVQAETTRFRNTIEAYMFAAEDIGAAYAATLYKHGATLCPVNNEIVLFP